MVPRVQKGALAMSSLFKFCLIALPLSVVACNAAFDSSRPASEPTSLGHVLYENFCDRLAATAYPEDRTGRSTYAVCHEGAAPAAHSAPKLLALHAERTRFIDAVDALMASDPALSADLSAYLTQLLPLYDNGIMAAQAHKLAAVIERVRGVPAVAQALERLGYRAPAAPAAPAGLLAALLQYPRLHEVLGSALAVLGPNAPGHAAFLQLQRVLQVELAADADALDPSAWAPLRNFLLSSLPEGVAQPQSRWLLAHDGRGMPIVARNTESPPARNTQGQLVNAPWGPPNTPGFDGYGRAVDAAGRPLFVYHDAGTSVLAGLLAQVQQVVAKNPTLLAQSAPALRAAMGEEKPRTRRLAGGQSLEWRGYDANTAPIADAGYTLGWLAQQRDVLPKLTALADALWQQHEPALAAAVQLGWQASDWAQNPEVRDLALKPGNTLIDDFIDLGVEMAQVDGLLEDVHAALQDPATQALGPILALHMQHSDWIDYPHIDGPNGLEVNGPPTGDFITKVQRSSADPRLNRSVMERLLHLVHDSQQPVCSAASEALNQPECFFFKIDNAARFYLQSVIGEARFVIRVDQDSFDQFATPGGMEQATTIEGFLNPHEVTEDCPVNPLTGEAARCIAFSVTPQAAARMLFVPFDSSVEAEKRPYLIEQLTRKVMVGNQPIGDVHHGTLFAWELHGFFDAVRPLLKAFAKHGREDLVLHLLNVLHKHWGKGDPSMTELQGDMIPWNNVATGLSQFEPLLAKLLTEGRFMQVAANLLQAAQAVQLDSANGSQVLAASLRRLLTPAGFHPAGPQPVRRADGSTVHHPAPLHVLQRALRDMTQAQAANPAVPAASLTAPLAQVLLPVSCTGGGCALSNREAHALVGAGLRFARAQVASKVNAAEAQGGMQAVGEAFTLAVLRAVDSPLTGSTVQVLGQAANNAAASAELGKLLDKLLTQQHAGLVDLATAAVDGLPQANDLQPLRHAAAAVLDGAADGSGSLVEAQLQMLAQAYAADPQRVLSRVLKGLAAPTQQGSMALSVLTDVFAQVNRAAPGAPGPLQAADYNAGLLATLQDFLQDSQHGFARLLDLIAQRHAPAPQGHGAVSHEGNRS